jgi:hypothetical protein
MAYETLFDLPHNPALPDERRELALLVLHGQDLPDNLSLGHYFQARIDSAYLVKVHDWPRGQGVRRARRLLSLPPESDDECEPSHLAVG